MHNLNSNVLYINIVRRYGGESLISVKYTKDNTFDEDLISAFLQALSIYSSDDNSTDGLSSIEKEGFNHIIENGEQVFAVIVLKNLGDEELVRKKLRELCREFEDMYDYYLKNWNGNITHFREFLIYIVSKFPPIPVKEDVIPVFINKGATKCVGHSADIVENVRKLINGKRTVEYIINAADVPEQYIIGALSLMAWNNEIKFKKAIQENDKPRIIGRINPRLKQFYADVIDQLLVLCNGQTTLKEISGKLGLDFSTTKYIIEKLSEDGIVEFR